MLSFILRAIGVLILVTVVAVALSRAPDRGVQTLVARWAPPPSDFVEVKGQLVHIRDEGPRHTGVDSPPPLLLIHGTSASLHTWQGWVAGLKGQRRIISFDLPGFGLTGPYTGQYPPDDYSGEAYAGFVLDLLDHLQLQQVVIAGNSLGGEVAWHTALRAPQRVQSLILVDSAGLPLTGAQLPLGWQLARIPLLGRLLESMLPRSLVAEGLAGAYGDPSRITPELVDRYFELTLREGNRRALGQHLRSWVPGAGAGRIAELRQPTLLLWGGRDRLIPPAAGAEFQRRISGSKLVVFDQLGHVPQEEDPARSLVPVREFLGLR